MRISELKERKIVRRATRNFDFEGKRIYNEFEYDLPYKTIYINNERDRLFAKIIDMIPCFLIFLFIFKEPAFFSLIFSILCVIISGTISENLFGTTLGKKIFKIRVIDDFGNDPNFFKSFMRNLLCLANFFPVFTDYTSSIHDSLRVEGMHMNFSMHLNNKLCKTHTVKEYQFWEIKKLLDQDILKQKNL
ncbi:MAG: hypothetical protein K0R36_189 [Chryseobacterium sp.]|jgi:hypothetical protein|nr:hypothetical protein [Chryseobacterium sp.]